MKKADDPFVEQLRRLEPHRPPYRLKSKIFPNRGPWITIRIAAVLFLVLSITIQFVCIRSTLPGVIYLENSVIENSMNSSAIEILNDQHNFFWKGENNVSQD